MAKLKSAKMNKEHGVLNAGTFGIALDRFTGKVEMHLRQKIARVFLEAYVEILNETPVDTRRAQSSWKLDVAKQDREVSPNARYVDKTTGKFAVDEAVVATYPPNDYLLDQAGTRIKKFLNRNYKKVPTKQSRSGYRKQFTTFKTRGPIYITNRVPYMAKLEGGYSQQNALFVERASNEISRKLKEERSDCQDFGKPFKKNQQFIKVVEKVKASFANYQKPKPEGSTSKSLKKDTQYIDKTKDVVIEEDEAEFWKQYGAEFAIEQKKFEKGSRMLETGDNIEGVSAFTRKGMTDMGASTKMTSKNSSGDLVSLKPKKNNLFSNTSLQETKASNLAPKATGKRRKSRRIKAHSGENPIAKWQSEIRKGMKNADKKSSNKGGFWKPES
tara:strand:- start:3874 stop:5031 length:1158 start_codon:yes stop_codon:yes gene_type:complete